MANESHELRRELHLWDAVAAIIGTVVGAGIFRVPATIAQLIPDERLILLAWVLGGFLSLCGALTFAELASAFPTTGGEYVYLRETFGKPFSFVYGWTLFLVIRAGSLASVAYIFAEYAAYFLPVGSIGIKIIASAGVIFLTVVNFYGVQYGKGVQSFFSGLKVGVLLLIALIGVFSGPRTGIEETVIGEGRMQISQIGAFGLAMIFVLWTYGGWNESAYLGGEVKNPERNLPLSIVLGIILVTGLYVTVNWVYLHVLSVAEIQKTDVVASRMMDTIFGGWGGMLISFIILLMTFGSMNTMVLTDARIGYAVGKDHPRFAFLKQIHPKFRTPYIAMMINLVWILFLIWTGSFEKLVTYTSVVFWFFFGMTGVGLIILKQKRHAEIKFKAWGYPFTVIIFIVTTIFLLMSTLIERPHDSLMGLGIAMLGIPVYYFSKLRKD